MSEVADVEYIVDSVDLIEILLIEGLTNSNSNVHREFLDQCFLDCSSILHDLIVIVQEVESQVNGASGGL